MNDIKKKIRELGAMKQDMEAGIEGTADDEITKTTQLMRRFIREGGQVASGDLERTVQFTKVPSKNGQIYTISAGAGVDYAHYVEFGTGIRGDSNFKGMRFESPDNPPVRQIYEWLQDKGENPSWSKAWAIAWGIVKYGTRPHPFFRPAMRYLFKTLPDEVQNEVEDSIKRHN